MIEFPTILLERVTLALAGVHNSRRDPHRRSRAAMAAADFYFGTREAAIRREERAALREDMEMSVTVAVCEQSARHDFQQQALAACRKVACKHYRTKRVVASDAALECVEAVRALLPALNDSI